MFPIVQSYKFKSKSQRQRFPRFFREGVSDSSKLQIQKQITTDPPIAFYHHLVFPIVQSYKFKSKSQPFFGVKSSDSGVSDSSKLQIQKQITTQTTMFGVPGWVFPIVQSYKFKSKSQPVRERKSKSKGVSDSSKLQIQKQITTTICSISSSVKVFPIVQSYKFKSKSQRR